MVDLDTIDVYNVFDEAMIDIYVFSHFHLDQQVDVLNLELIHIRLTNIRVVWIPC